MTTETETKVLVVDDEPINVALLVKVLKQSHFEVLVASHGEEAILQATRDHPDIILLDIMMPGMDGFDVCRILKKDPAAKDIPVIFITGLAETDQIVKGFRYGAVDYITKPFKLEEVVMRINSHIMIRRQKIELEQLNDELSRTNENLKQEIRIREKTEQSLLNEKKRMDLYLNTAEVMLLALDRKGCITSINKKGRRILEYENEEIIGKNWFDNFLPPDIRKDIRNIYHRLMTGETEQNRYVVGRILTKTGREKEIVWNNSIVRDEEGKIIGTFSSGEDTTVLRSIEYALSETENRLKLIADELPVLISYVDKEERYRFVNRQYERWFNLPSSEIIGKTVKTILGPGRYEQIRHHVQYVLSGYPLNEEFEMFFADKVSMTLYSHYIPHIDSNNVVQGYIFMCEDITWRKKIEKEKSKLEEKLRQSQKMEAIGALAAGIAHDFNNILNVIFGYTDLLLLETPMDNPVYDYIREISLAGQRANELVSQILTFSRTSEHHFSQMKMISIVKECLKFLRSSLPSTIEIKKDIRAVNDTIFGNPTQIHQIIMNLCTNAAHSMKEFGALEVGLYNMTVDEENMAQFGVLDPGDYLVLKIADTGCGICAKTIDKIFEPYYTTKEINEGAGIGLAVVHGIVKAHNAEIIVSSSLGHGTVFEVFFPLIPDFTENTDNIGKKGILGGTEHILFIDDEISIVEMGKKLLQRLGYRVTAFSDAIDALHCFLENPEKFDIVITDQTMPNITGIEIASKMLNVRPNVPIILCTGFSNLVSHEIIKKRGIKHLLLKPFNTKAVSEVIRNILDGESIIA